MLRTISLILTAVGISFILFSTFVFANLSGSNHFVLLILGLKFTIAAILILILSYNLKQLSKHSTFKVKKTKKEELIPADFYENSFVDASSSENENISKVRKHKRYHAEKSSNIKLELLRNKQFYSFEVKIDNVSKNGIYLICNEKITSKDREHSLRVNDIIPTQKLDFVRFDILDDSTFGYAFSFKEPFDLERQRDYWNEIKSKLLNAS